MDLRLWHFLLFVYLCPKNEDMGRWLLFFMLFAAVGGRGQECIRNLDIQVVIADDGAARVTECRDMVIDDSGTEYYISLKNLRGMDVADVTVSDTITGRYETLANWDLEASRREKAGKCGLHRTDDGYELCWGKGAAGERCFQVEYTLKGLVRHFEDADGMNYMFVTPHAMPIRHARVILSLDNGDSLGVWNSRIWGFGYEGSCLFSDGKIVAETDGENQEDVTVIVTARFDHGVLHPSASDEGTFEQMRERALEGSDYLEEKEEPMGFYDYVGLVITCLICLVPIVFAINLVRKYLPTAVVFVRRAWDWLLLGPVRRRLKQKRFVNNADYYRDLPLDDSIAACNYVMNSTKYLRPYPDASPAIQAYILRLIGRKCLGVNSEQQLTVGKWEDGPSADDDSRHEKAIYNILQEAAGEDKTLQPQELKDYLEKSAFRLRPLFDLENSAGIYFDDYEDTYQPDATVMGFRRYLKDFSIIGERSTMEVGLWREYLVMATLFGIADRVKEDMRKICPEFFEAEALYSNMVDTTTVTTLASVIAEKVDDGWLADSPYKLSESSSRDSSRSVSRYEGGGGSSSRSGGGGHRGGGRSGSR